MIVMPWDKQVFSTNAYSPESVKVQHREGHTVRRCGWLSTAYGTRQKRRQPAVLDKLVN